MLDEEVHLRHEQRQLLTKLEKKQAVEVRSRSPGRRGSNKHLLNDK